MKCSLVSSDRYYYSEVYEIVQIAFWCVKLGKTKCMKERNKGMEKFPTIKALIFDMDGLIFDSERVVQRSWNQAGQILGYGLIGEHIYHTLGFNVVRRTAYMKETFGPDFPMDDFNTITRRIFHEIAEKEGVSMKPGVKELFMFAKKKEWKLAVATSSRREHSISLLKSAGIWDYLDGAIFGDMVTVAKSNPEIYLKAAEIIGAEPEYCIALEDSPAGIQSSHAAGMYPIMVPDLVQPTDEIRALCWKCVESLETVIEILGD